MPNRAAFWWRLPVTQVVTSHREGSRKFCLTNRWQCFMLRIWCLRVALGRFTALLEQARLPCKPLSTGVKGAASGLRACTTPSPRAPNIGDDARTPARPARPHARTRAGRWVARLKAWAIQACPSARRKRPASVACALSKLASGSRAPRRALSPNLHQARVHHVVGPPPLGRLREVVVRAQNLRRGGCGARAAPTEGASW